MPPHARRTTLGFARATRAVVASTLLAACASTPATPSVQSWLDPRTAVTVRAMGEPWIYARDANEIAVHARDYRSLGLVERNRMGERRWFLVLVEWSTVDRSGLPAAAPAAEVAPSLDWEGRAGGALPAAGTRSDAVSISQPLFRPPSGYRGELWYEIAARDVHALADAVPKWLELHVGDEAQRWMLWRANPAAVTAFADEVP